VLAAVLLLVAVIIGASRSLGASSQAPPAHHVSSQGNDPLKTITAYQLAQMRLQLAAPSGTPDVSPAAADAAAEKVFPDPIAETALATCSVGDSDLQDALCWVVSMDPQASSAIPLQCPDSDYDASHPVLPTVEVVLIGAQDPSVLVAFQNSFPPSPSTS